MRPGSGTGLQGYSAAAGEHWKAALSGAPALLELPATGRGRRNRTLPEADQVALDAGLTQPQSPQPAPWRHAVYDAARGWAALLTRLSGQHEVVIGSASANRSRIEVEPLIGFFVNTLALRIDVSGAPTVSELLARVKAQVLSAQEHQDFPFEQVVEAVQPPRRLAHRPVPVMFAWQNARRATLSSLGSGLPRSALPHVTAMFDLTLSLEEKGEQIVGGLEYAAALFDRTTIERYLGYWCNLLEAMSTDEARPIDRLPLLSHFERHQLLVEWNATDTEYPRERCVHELFEAQAAKTPHAIAVEHHDTAGTYAELNACANRLARLLRALGVRPGIARRSFLNARWIWWRRNSLSSRVAPPMCRSIRAFPPNARLSWSATAGPMS